MVVNRRFIAGARCPGCGNVDTIVLMQEQGEQIFECVECGFHERMSESSQSAEKKSSEEIIQLFPTNNNDEK